MVPVMLNHIIRRLICTLMALAFAAPMAGAQNADGLTGATIRPGWLTPEGHYMAAISLTLAPGWKTYWRAPGEAGIAPQLDWSESQNLAEVVLHWPRPDVFEISGLQSIGYHDALVLPVEVTPRDPSKPVVLRLRGDLGICKNICVPASIDLQADLAGKGAPDAVIAAALRARPATAAEAGVTAIGCTVAPISDGLRLTAVITLPSQGQGETVIFETADPELWVTKAEVGRAGGILTASSDLLASRGAVIALQRSGVTVTVLGAGGAVEIIGCPAG